MNNKEIRIENIKNLTILGLDVSKYKLWLDKYNSKKLNAKNIGVKCHLSFYEYLSLAVVAGINDPILIGRSNKQFQLGRFKDSGDYDINSCRFITQEQNLIEKKINGGTYRGASHVRGFNSSNSKTIANNALKIMGRTKKSHISIKSQSEKLSKPYIIMSPDGKIYEGLGISQFCDEHKLCKVGMSATCRGEQKTHKGWSGRYV